MKEAFNVAVVFRIETKVTLFTVNFSTPDLRILYTRRSLYDIQLIFPLKFSHKRWRWLLVNLAELGNETHSYVIICCWQIACTQERIQVIILRYCFFQPVANTSRSLIYMLLVIVLTFFQEDTLGDIQVKWLCVSFVFFCCALCCNIHLTNAVCTNLNSAVQASWQYCFVVVVAMSRGNEEACYPYYTLIHVLQIKWKCVLGYVKLHL